ncbi:MAG: hypothetical protein ABSC20_12380 [Candidatus Bathyarchaeia archaeon]|jgi:preprotein translocase subunit Sss1
MNLVQIRHRGKSGRPKGLGAKWAYIIEIAIPAILKEYGDLPLTIRQIFYRLVGKYSLDKTENNYQYLDKQLVQHRKNAWIKWDRIVDLTRKPTKLEYHTELTPEDWIRYWAKDFIDSLSGYHQPEYTNQEYLVEVWSEHEGLQPLFKKALENYPVTLYFTRGRNSWSNFYESAQRLKQTSRKIVILHFADADDYGRNMTKNIQDAFEFFEVDAEVVRVALTNEQVREWNLPDTQLEAIEPDRMITLIQDAVRKYIDREKLIEMLEEQRRGQEVVDRWKEQFEEWYDAYSPDEES